MIKKINQVLVLLVFAAFLGVNAIHAEDATVYPTLPGTSIRDYTADPVSRLKAIRHIQHFREPVSGTIPNQERESTGTMFIPLCPERA